jgi:hypothetical protein
MIEILPLLQKGALVTQNPANFEGIAELEGEQRQFLREESSHRWRLPKALYLTIILNSIAGAMQVWDQTGSNGANLSFPKEYGIANGLLA